MAPILNPAPPVIGNTTAMAHVSNTAPPADSVPDPVIGTITMGTAADSANGATNQTEPQMQEPLVPHNPSSTPAGAPPSPDDASNPVQPKAATAPPITTTPDAGANTGDNEVKTSSLANSDASLPGDAPRNNLVDTEYGENVPDSGKGKRKADDGDLDEPQGKKSRGI